MEKLREDTGAPSGAASPGPSLSCPHTPLQVPVAGRCWDRMPSWAARCSVCDGTAALRDREMILGSQD